jgi:hypothetical protein
MYEGRMLFSQIMDSLPRKVFDRCVAKYNGSQPKTRLPKQLHSPTSTAPCNCEAGLFRILFQPIISQKFRQAAQYLPHEIAPSCHTEAAHSRGLCPIVIGMRRFPSGTDSRHMNSGTLLLRP